MRIGTKGICLTAILSCGGMCVDAAAESGTYESLASLVTNYTKSEHGDETIIGGSSSGTSTVTKSTGSLFKEGSSSLMECIVFAKRSTSGLDMEAPCTSTSSSGDKLFTLARRKIGDVTAGSTGEGKSEITGGTGAYAGLTGSCTYKIDYLSANRAVSISKCEWRK